ncbi:MAG: bifunctional nicotinamidase/pyrazinamidase [Promethearchaeota archaeon]
MSVMALKQEIEIKTNSALIVVDMQYDFLPGGALEVKEGDEIIEGINNLIKKFYDNKSIVVLTQDWHPPDHKSFASQYPDKNPLDPIDTEGLGPVLWPDHCIQGTPGAEISDRINKNLAFLIIRKGYNKEIDSYSAFYENDKKTKTGLAGFLKDKKIKDVYICGLALDFCCYYTAMDAKKEGFEVYFVKDLMKGIDVPEGNVENVLNEMEKAGIHIITSSSIK